MFITKKHIPRRTFLRGAGVTLALPLLESMLPAQTPLRLTAAAPVETLRRHLASAWRGAGLLESRCRKARTSSFRSSRNRWSRSAIASVLITGLDMPEAMATDDEPGGDHARGAVVAVRRPPATKRGESLSGRHDRSDDREEVRPGHDPVLHSTRRRGYRELRQLQLGLQLRLHELHLLVVAHAAASDRSQSARGLRAHVRRWHESGGAAGRTKAERQHSRFGHA